MCISTTSVDVVNYAVHPMPTAPRGQALAGTVRQLGIPPEVPNDHGAAEDSIATS